ncbi:wyosine base formation [Colletotrichum karsti]|uniref:tRNA 4-demethylwyosine synthase (AdoMet-dependent) n=1 Tax=Colletotrichum karsti TaxID=1095194 RepID=A0A9P6IGN7_9PEZI|nr:wyosine base formation [Colletotrichum karsti]KAF9881741.1 wyosine base formation [Colletotrichum karsti]
MGTGIVSILLHNLPYNVTWISHGLAIAFFVLNVGLFTVFTAITILRYALYPEIWKAMVIHPAQSMFLGCYPMGFATIINMMVFVCAPAWGDWVVSWAWGFWWLDAALSLATCITVPFVMIHQHRPGLQAVTAASLLPIVPTVVASSTGGIVAEALANPDHAFITLIASYILWGIGICFSGMVLALYFHRLTIHSLPSKEAIVSVFLPIGPLGQGGFGIQQLGKVSLKLLPQTTAFTTLAPSAIHGGEILYFLGIFLALIMWGFALVWLSFALISIATMQKFPFNMGWWGFTFPLGVMATCTGMLAQELDSSFFRVATMSTAALPISRVIMALPLEQPGFKAMLNNFHDVWQEIRIPVILFTAFGLLVLRFYLHSAEEKGDLKAFPKVLNNEKPQSKPKPQPKPVEEKKDVKPIPVVESKVPKSSGPRRIKGGLVKRPSEELKNGDGLARTIRPLIFFSSITANTPKIAKDYAERLEKDLQKTAAETGCSFMVPEVLDLAEVDFDDYFITPPKSDEPVELFYLFLLPSYNIDTINDTFLEHLQETHHDFRIDTAPLSPLLGYSVFGFGDREGWPTEDEGFCFQAKEVDKWMAKLTGRKRAFPVGMGDTKRDYAERLSEWSEGVVDVLGMVAKTGSLGEGLPGSGAPDESDDESAAEDDDEVLIEDSEAKPEKLKNRKNIDDVEDLGRIMKNSNPDADTKPSAAPIAVDFTTYGKSAATKKTPTQGAKEMVPKNSPTYASLTKQGYSIVGSHSGVKICRWTKSALRGRGSCYKYSFYGINSHQCMETTPSLSCSNKCVFCWRHGTNPVGTTWRWVVDPPELIFDGVKANHYNKIKMLRGVPGVRAERFAEAMRIRHCALSLVGEPIFYPYINEFLGMLHAERISSFLVCNAQHPDQLAALKAVTQLYVSIDASNKESLRKIDRPLHRDFWERFQRCLEILREKRFKHRTVFRLTLVKGFNVDDEVEGYAQLVEKGLPCFVEIKGVTYCGTSTASNAGLSMSNVPFYWEVSEFVTALEKRLNEKGLKYGIAAEHAHSCCVLLASDRFYKDGKWHPRIDYQRFFELLEERGADGDWKPEDYMGEATPEWAEWGNGGFDPRDDRVDRKGRKIEA